MVGGGDKPKDHPWFSTLGVKLGPDGNLKFTAINTPEDLDLVFQAVSQQNELQHKLRKELQIEEMAGSAGDHRISLATLNKKLTIIRGFFNVCIQRGLFSGPNPFAELKGASKSQVAKNAQHHAPFSR